MGRKMLNAPKTQIQQALPNRPCFACKGRGFESPISTKLQAAARKGRRLLT